MLEFKQTAGDVVVEIRVGNRLTTNGRLANAVHPLMSVPVTVYVKLEVGVAKTEFPVVRFNPVEGVHK